MNMGKKELCKQISSKILEKDFKEYIRIVKEPKYVCLKCGRVAKKEGYLCKAEKI